MPSYSDEAQQRAGRLVERAISSGELVPATHCESCGRERGEQRLDAHHANGYGSGHELDVTWLCRSCHSRLHAGPNGARSLNASLTPEERRASAKRASAAVQDHSRGGRDTVHLQRYWEEHPEQLREAGRRGAAARASMSPERRSEIARKINATRRSKRPPDEQVWLELRLLANRRLRELRSRNGGRR